MHAISCSPAGTNQNAIHSIGIAEVADPLQMDDQRKGPI